MKLVKEAERKTENFLNDSDYKSLKDFERLRESLRKHFEKRVVVCSRQNLNIALKNH